MPTPTEIVNAWQAAANRQDLEQLLALSDPQIAIVGPRGTGYGHQLLRDWLARAGLNLTTQRVYARGDTVVVAQHAVWRAVDTGVLMGESDLASLFRLAGQRVVYYARFEQLEEALAAAQLTEADVIA